MKAALYVRVSTEEQAKEGFSINAQKQRLREFVKSQGWTLYKEYVDEGYSAKNLERPAMQTMIDDIKKGNFDVVLVYRLDRMVRSVLDLHALLKLFEEHKVMFKSATEMFDTTSAMGRFFITLVGAMAAWERENLGERVHMGMKRMVEEGNRAGAKSPYGYDMKDGQLYVNKSEAKWIRYIFDKYRLQGGKTISMSLNDKGIRTKKNYKWRAEMINYIVSNPVYCGYIRWNSKEKEIIVKGSHEPIISEEVFNEIQKIKKSRTVKKGYKGHISYPFTGVLKCGRCGSNMTGARKKKTDYRYYRCTGKKLYSNCDMPLISEELIEHEFLNHLELQKGVMEIEEDTIDISELKSELSKIESAKQRVKDMYKWGDIEGDEYREELDKLSEKETQLSEQIESVPTPINIDEVNELLSHAKDNWPSFTYEQRKGFVHSLVSSLTVDVIEESNGQWKPAKIKILDAEIN